MMDVVLYLIILPLWLAVGVAGSLIIKRSINPIRIYSLFLLRAATGLGPINLVVGLIVLFASLIMASKKDAA